MKRTFISLSMLGALGCAAEPDELIVGEPEVAETPYYGCWNHTHFVG